MKKRAFFFPACLGLAVLALGSCSGYEDSLGRLTIQFPPSSEEGGRYLSADRGMVNIGLMKGRQVYDYLEADSQSGIITMGNLIPDSYLLPLVLYNKAGDMIAGIAIKEITIEPGLNTHSILIGPGAEFLAMNDINVENLFGELPPGYYLSFKNDTVIINAEERRLQGDEIRYKPIFGDQEPGVIMNVTTLEGKELFGQEIPDLWILPPESNGIIFTIIRKSEPLIEYTNIVEIR